MNFSSIGRTNGLVVTTQVKVRYDARLEDVDATLIAAAQATKGVTDKITPQYLAQGFYGNELSAEMGVEDIGKGGFVLLFRLTRIADGKVLARARTGMVCFDYARQKVCRLPEALKTVLEVV